MDKTKLQRIWDNMNENERFGLSFGLFPFRLEQEKLSNEESAELIRMSQAKTKVEF
jgi:hypothetical protein